MILHLPGYITRLNLAFYAYLPLVMELLKTVNLGKYLERKSDWSSIAKCPPDQSNQWRLSTLEKQTNAAVGDLNATPRPSLSPAVPWKHPEFSFT